MNTTPQNPPEAPDDPNLELLEQLVDLLITDVPVRTDAAMAAAMEQRGQTLERQLTALARWRLACGDLQTAAQWHRAALPPHDLPAIRSDVQIWLRCNGQVALAARLSPGQGTPRWTQLLRQLRLGHYNRASQLQRQLVEQGQLGTGHNDAAAPSTALRLLLIWDWLQAGRDTEALEMFELQGVEPLRPEHCCQADLAAAIAWLLRLHDPNASAAWEQESQRLNSGLQNP